LVFFLAGFLASRFGAFLFAMPKVYAIGQTVQDPFGKLTTTLNPSNLPDFGASGYNRCFGAEVFSYHESSNPSQLFGSTRAVRLRTQLSDPQHPPWRHPR
jgi:hypothetical protein